jgi:N-methylhydantoinase A/oxoprolinase/acetone carboxylase beta subunit
MSLALRRVSVERGLDPENYTLVSFGGAGPLHSGLLLRELGFRSLLVPRHPGLFAAAGLVSTDLRIDESRTVLEILEAAALPELAAWLKSTARDMTDRLVQDGIARRGVRIIASADCRFVGQGFELNVALPTLTVQGLRSITRRFDDLHLRTYGHTDPEGRVEVVTMRLSAFGALPGITTTIIARAGRVPVEKAVGVFARCASTIVSDCAQGTGSRDPQSSTRLTPRHSCSTVNERGSTLARTCGSRRFVERRTQHCLCQSDLRTGAGIAAFGRGGDGWCAEALELQPDHP